MKGDLRLLSIEESQEYALGVLNELDSFCRSNGLTYFLIGGALIGGVRDGNLVPWDDDIDVAMSRDDYERFCDEYKDRGAYRLLTNSRCGEYRSGVAKLIDTRTVFLEKGAIFGEYGVFVDIFPLDSVQSETCGLVKKVFREVKLYNYTFVSSEEAFEGSSLKRAIWRILRSTVGRGSQRNALLKVEALMKSGEGDTRVNSWGAWGLKECGPKEWFDSIEAVTIRNRQYMAPCGYHQWLSKVYGDYLVPPSNPPQSHGHAYLKI